MESAIAEGPKFLYEFIVSGQVPELNDVIDEIKEEYKTYNGNCLDEDMEDMSEPPEPKKPPPLFPEGFFSKNHSSGRRENSRFMNNSDSDQDMRHSYSFGQDSDMRNTSDVDYRDSRPDSSFGSQDQDMRNADPKMHDEDFRVPYPRDQDYRSRYNDEEGDEGYDNNEDYDQDRNWQQNGNYQGRNNYNSNFQSFRQSNFNRNEGNNWQGSSDGDSNYRNNRGKRGNNSWSGSRSSNNSWSQRGSAPYKSNSRGKSSSRSNRRY